MNSEKVNISWIIEEIKHTLLLATNYGKDISGALDYIPTGLYQADAIINDKGNVIWKISLDDESIEDFLNNYLICFSNILESNEELVIPLSQLFELYNLAKNNRRAPLDMVDYDQMTSRAIDTITTHDDSEFIVYGLDCSKMAISGSDNLNSYSIVPFRVGEISKELKALLFSASHFMTEDSLDLSVLSCQVILKLADSPKTLAKKLTK